MTSPGWNSQYSVHISTFDTQHQQMLAMIKQVQKSAQTGGSPDHIAKLFDELMECTRFHFDSEEKAMQRHGFDGYTPHRTEHQALLRKANDYHRQFIEGKTMIPVEIMRYLNDWLLHHIETMDRQYDSFFHEKGVT